MVLKALQKNTHTHTHLGLSLGQINLLQNPPFINGPIERPAPPISDGERKIVYNRQCRTGLGSHVSRPHCVVGGESSTQFGPVFVPPQEDVAAARADAGAELEQSHRTGPSEGFLEPTNLGRTGELDLGQDRSSCSGAAHVFHVFGFRDCMVSAETLWVLVGMIRWISESNNPFQALFLSSIWSRVCVCVCVARAADGCRVFFFR